MNLRPSSFFFLLFLVCFSPSFVLLFSRSCAFWSPFFFPFLLAFPLGRFILPCHCTVRPWVLLAGQRGLSVVRSGTPLGCRPCLRDNRQVLAPSCQPCPFSLSLSLSLPLLASGGYGVPSRGRSMSLGLILHSFFVLQPRFNPKGRRDEPHRTR